ncbi:hypothetical protein IWX78_000955 [Mycetocola sp. CAN_C7]|uniref:HNH endonuclease signature motif containing protein n=1 Tax=Mycetocola sp. CAN_C7 TaxID=2787724 RepID=UPI0018CB33AB
MQELLDPPQDADDDVDPALAVMFDDGPIEPPLSSARANAVSALVDEVAASDRDQAKLMAWQVERIDEARRLAEITEHGVLTFGSTLTESQRREMARRSLIAELACALRMPEATVRGMLADSEALMSRLPATMDALRGGEISYRHARVIVDQISTLNPDAASALEQQALPFAKALTVPQFTSKARLLRERLDEESIAARVAKSAKDRRLDFEPAADGMAWLSLYTTAPEASSIFTAIRDRADVLRKKPGEERTLPQLSVDVCADALAAALSGDLLSGLTGPTDPTDLTDPAPQAEISPSIGSGFAFSRIRPTVVVTVPALTLLGWGDQPATLDGYGPIDAKTARLLAGQAATWNRMLTDPKTGAPIALDSTTYRPSKAMRRYLRYVDGTCRFPGCRRAARHCDLDHTKDHQFGGATQCENLSHLCPKHHRLKHQTIWRAEQLSAGALRWTSPGGRTYVTQPDIILSVPGPPREKQTSPPQQSQQSQPNGCVDDTPPF